MAKARVTGALSAEALDQLDIPGDNIRLARRVPRVWGRHIAADGFVGAASRF